MRFGHGMESRLPRHLDREACVAGSPPESDVAISTRPGPNGLHAPCGSEGTHVQTARSWNKLRPSCGNGHGAVAEEEPSIMGGSRGAPLALTPMQIGRMGWIGRLPRLVIRQQGRWI